MVDSRVEEPNHRNRIAAARERAGQGNKCCDLLAHQQTEAQRHPNKTS